MKQTAVEFLIQQIVNRINSNSISRPLNEIYEQALEMEKQQIIAAVEWNYKSNMGEVYYNAVYKKDNV